MVTKEERYGYKAKQVKRIKRYKLLGIKLKSYKNVMYSTGDMKLSPPKTEFLC